MNLRGSRAFSIIQDLPWGTTTSLPLPPHLTPTPPLDPCKRQNHVFHGLSLPVLLTTWTLRAVRVAYLEWSTDALCYVSKDILYLLCGY